MSTARLVVKLLIIFGLVIFLFISIGLITSLVSDRQVRRHETADEVSKLWGGNQRVTGPFLEIPYSVFHYDTKGKVIGEGTDKIVLLPEILKIAAEVPTNEKHRGIFKIRTFSLRSLISGNFKFPDLQKLNVIAANVRWSEAKIVHYLSDANSLDQRVIVTFDGQQHELEPDPGALEMEGMTPLSSAINLDTKLGMGETIGNFQYSTVMHGTEQVEFSPIGSETEVSVKSNWPSPSFFGSRLPTASTISDEGFESTWNRSYVGRAFPKVWVASSSFTKNIETSNFGVALIEPVNVYQQLERTFKYVMLIIVLTFALFFVLEVLSKQDFHPMQYSLVGGALTVFYLLLISLSEHLVFWLSYTLAAGMVVVLVSTYMKFVVRRMLHVLIVAGSLIVLYSYIYVLLMAEELSLLMGSVGLFAVIALIMFVTRNVDWYNFNNEKPTTKIPEPLP